MHEWVIILHYWIGGVNLNTARELMGHVDERTTLKNYCYDRSPENDRIERIEKALTFGIV